MFPIPRNLDGAMANPAAENPEIPSMEDVQFDWADPFYLAHILTAEERMVREAARDYCKDKLAPRILQAFRNEKFDRSILREMGEMGFLGLTLPETYGGAGMNYVCYGLVAREVEGVDSGYRSAMSVQN